MHAVLTLLAGPGVVWELAFGSWVLLQPERINAYAQAVIGTLRADKQQRGCVMEERVLKGDLMYESSMERLQGDEERFVLLAMHQTLVERGLCLRQPAAQGNLLVFPSYYRKERPDIEKHPAVQVNYRFTGFLDEIYATLVVRLNHSDAFQQDELWRYAADFKTNAGKQLGIKLTRRAPGAGELEVYFDNSVSVQEKIIFSKYVHEHLLQHARDVERLRHYVCPECGTPVGNREVAMQRLNEWLGMRPPMLNLEATDALRRRKFEEKTPSIICVGCEKRVPLWDEMEQCFGSPEVQQRVRNMQEEANIELDNQSKERVLVGEVISTVALAGQISREFNVSDHGIDMEIEFKDDAHEATNRKLYLQLKSGDSYLRKRKSDGAEVFMPKDKRHALYWMAQAFPVMLVIRNSEDEVRWMEVRDWLKRASDNGKKSVKQIAFEGERFDVMSVLRWRDRMLGDWRPAHTSQPFERPDPEERRIAIKHLIATQPNNITRDKLIQLAFTDESEAVREHIVKELIELWQDERTREFLLKIGETDTSSEVRAISYEELSKMWWKMSGVRRWLRARLAHETAPPIRQRLIRSIESAGGQLADYWIERLHHPSNVEKEPETVSGSPSFSVSRFRLFNIGAFHDTREISMQRDVNVFLGDNAAGKTTILRALALAAVGLPASNEVLFSTNTEASSYLRKGSDFGSIEVLFELTPDPESLPAEARYFTVGLQIDAGTARFIPILDGNLSLVPPGEAFVELRNSATQLGELRSKLPSRFGFAAGYGAVRTFNESQDSAKAPLKIREHA